MGKERQKEGERRRKEKKGPEGNVTNKDGGREKKR